MLFRSVKMDEIGKGIIHNRRYRNRRIGDFLKELDMTEGRGTGIPIIRKEMKKNGSPEPRFETGVDYSYFITTLPIHPLFLENDGVDDGVNDGVNGGVDGGVKQAVKQEAIINFLVQERLGGGVDGGVNGIVSILLNASGLNAGEIAARINRSLRTTERYLQVLRKKEIIEFRGIPKTGGYHLTDEIKDKFK